jgi:hypothetical protein
MKFSKGQLALFLVNIQIMSYLTSNYCSLQTNPAQPRLLDTSSLRDEAKTPETAPPKKLLKKIATEENAQNTNTGESMGGDQPAKVPNPTKMESPAPSAGNGPDEPRNPLKSEAGSSESTPEVTPAKPEGSPHEESGAAGKNDEPAPFFRSGYRVV